MNDDLFNKVVLREHCMERYNRLCEDINKIWDALKEQDKEMIEMMRDIHSKFTKLYYLLFTLLGGIVTTLIAVLLKGK